MTVRVPGGEAGKNITTTRIYLNRSASNMTAWVNHKISVKNVFSRSFFFLLNQLLQIKEYKEKCRNVEEKDWKSVREYQKAVAEEGNSCLQWI